MKLKQWLNEKPDMTRLEMYSSMFIGVLIANILMDLTK